MDLCSFDLNNMIYNLLHVAKSCFTMTSGMGSTPAVLQALAVELGEDVVTEKCQQRLGTLDVFGGDMVSARLPM